MLLIFLATDMHKIDSQDSIANYGFKVSVLAVLQQCLVAL
jgi:hypothetical protein